MLRIHRLRRAPSGGWIVRFGGEGIEFWYMVSAFKAHYPVTRWERHAFGRKHGGWIVSDSILHTYGRYFENYQQCLEREQERQRVEQRRRDLAAVEQIRRELGITRDINACPF